MVERETLRIDQCLFGYADGHRLLEASIRLPPDIASDLTAASDVALGASFADRHGYWTGLPVPRLARYALMHTWPAPEMPRPGCVWTHLLLFDPILFEEIDDLSCFKALMRRPAAVDDYNSYASPIAAPSLADLSFNQLGSSTETHLPSRSSAIRVLEVLYGEVKGPVEVAWPGELDDLVLAVWSQQWPRLRRNFRFQTAASLGTEGASKRFDLQLRISRDSSIEVRNRSRKDAKWLDVAVDDIEGRDNHRLREFLRRYGQDVKRQRGSFRPLTQVYMLVESEVGGSRKDAPSLIARWFQDPDDASTMKHDLMNGQILADVQVDSVLYLCEVDKGRSLPMLSEVGFRNFAGNWPARSADMLKIAEWAATEDGQLAEAILSTVASAIPPANFWTATKGFPAVRRRMIASQPTLLDSQSIAALDPASLASLLDAVPADHEVGAVLVTRLRAPVDRRLVKKAFERFPTSTLLQVIRKANTLGVEAVGEWLQEVGNFACCLLDPAVMQTIRRTSVLVALAEALGWLSDEVLAHGIGPWMAGLANARDDLTETGRDHLEAFLFALALSVGGDQTQDVFERSFGYLHGKTTHSNLSWTALLLLQPRLPSAGIFRDWDNSLKLRLAVAQAYVRFDLDPESFGRLVQDKRERSMLRRTAEEVPGGQRFADTLLH
jgi:hypothetical protein